MPSCRECNQSFSVHPNDQKILDTFGVPAPTLCATHSLQQRLSWRNERHLYKRTCELCSKEILAMYSPASYAHVYCRECWYSDTWDAMTYGRPYDPSRSFFDQFVELLHDVPFFNLFQIGDSVNSSYCNIVYNSKDSYLSFSNVRSEGSLYSKTIDDSRDCTDSFCITQSERLYDCVSVNDSYMCAFLTRSEKCTSCYLSRDLFDCQDCFGCVNLKHKQYCWYNEQLSEQNYRARLGDALKDRASFEDQQKTFQDFSKKLPCENATVRSSEDVTGDYIYNSRQIRSSFFITEGENLGDCFRLIWNSKDNYRTSYGGQVVGSYNCQTNPFSSNACCTYGCEHCSFVSYCFYCLNSDSLFGCAGVRKKKFCILNTQYTEHDYMELRERIIHDMKERGEWGEYLPSKHLPHGYNDSVGYEYFPLTRDEVLARQWPWREEPNGLYGKETLSHDMIPDDIMRVDESITKQILACAMCGMNYKILKQELERLKSFHLPIPRECQDCRFKRRFTRSIVPLLYQRTCTCTESHSFHASKPCATAFGTTTRPDAQDTVYCKLCYQECLG